MGYSTKTTWDLAKTDKSYIMKAAWELARRGQKKFGGKVKDYLSESLKILYARIKTMVKVPTWFINKKFLVVGFCSDFEHGYIEKETEKAIFVKLRRCKERLWVPKSIMGNQLK